MCWVAAERGIHLAESRGDTERAEKWQKAADQMHAEICKKGVDDRGVFTQHYDTDDLDASLLLIPIMGFLPPDDERVHAPPSSRSPTSSPRTASSSATRSSPPTTGCPAKRARSRSARSGWSPRSRSIGETERARALFEKLLSFAGPLLLYAEEIDATTGQHLGNFPQAFTHLALIDAANRLIAAEPTAHERAGAG